MNIDMSGMTHPHSANLRRIADSPMKMLLPQDYISLRQAADALEWVKCSERLPEPLQCVLAISRGGATLLAWWSKVNRCWVAHDAGEDIDPSSEDEPTHWMPLPPPPAD